MIKFGKINAIGDPNIAEQAGKYKVMLLDDDIQSGWLYQLKRNSLKNQDDYSFDLNEPVVVLFDDHYRTGIILGAYSNQATKNATTNPDLEQMKFSDGTIVSYNRKEHVMTMDMSATNGKLIINGGNNKGLLILDSSIKSWNQIENDVNKLKAAFVALAQAAPAVLTSAVGTPDTGLAALVSALADWYGTDLIVTKAEAIEDVNVKH